jgi:hypothetical protein
MQPRGNFDCHNAVQIKIMRQSLLFLSLVFGSQILVTNNLYAQVKKKASPSPNRAVKKAPVKAPAAKPTVVKPTVAPVVPLAPTFLDDEAEESFNLSFLLKKSSTIQSLVFDYQDEKNYYLLEIDGTQPKTTTAKFWIVQNGKKKILSSAPVVLAAQNNFVLQRRPWSMQLIARDKVSLRAFDATWTEGQIGHAGSGFSEFRVQPTEKVRFDDDFTRAGQSSDNDWKTHSGKWLLSASSEHVNSRNANMSSNPFAFEVNSPQGEALATGGRWFWDSYDARVAVRPFSNGEIGIAAYVKDAKNYLAFKWNSNNSSAARRIVLVSNGVETVLASGKGAYLPRQWYEIGLRLSPGYVEALMDGVPVLRAATEALGQGGVGLWAKNIENAAFDDIKVRSYDFLRPQFVQNGSWQIQSGAWKFAGPQTNIAGEGIVTIGPKQNQNYRALITMPLNGTGLVTGWQDSKNYSLFRVVGGNAQIVRIENGQSSILSNSAYKISTNQDGTARFLLETTNGVLTVSQNDQIIAQSAGAELTNGKFGLFSKSVKPVTFKDPVLFFPPPPEPFKVAEKMENDPYMVGWASASGEWPVTPTRGGLEFWNAGEHFGDVTLSFPWRKTWLGAFEVALRAKRGEFKSGLVLRGKQSENGENVDWQLLQGDNVLAKNSVKLTELPYLETVEGAKLQVALKGAGLVLSSENGPILSYLGLDKFTGTGLGVRSQGFRISNERLQASTTNRDDYTFTGAPTDFYSTSGQWSIFSRWPCYGDWSFFGGDGQNPVLWSKKQYSGDVVAEYYAHPQMILPKEPGYSHPGDLNVTIGGDGKNPASGYSFIVAGWDNTKSALYRGNELVAESSSPSAYFDNTINHAMSWHRRWIYIRAEVKNAVKDGKTGAMITLSIDNKKLLEWFDEQPLESWKNGGRVAFWTVDSTMMIARAKIEAQNMGLKSIPADLVETRNAAKPIKSIPSAQGTGLFNITDEKDFSAIITPKGSNWSVRNSMSGGTFSVGINAPATPVTLNSQFTFDAALAKDVKIDLYTKVDGTWYTFELSGAQRNDPFAPTIGKATVSATSQPNWKTYRFSIGEGLAKELPSQKSWNIEEVRLGAMQGNAYRWIGFDGNNFGDGYEIGNIQWQ